MKRFSVSDLFVQSSGNLFPASVSYSFPCLTLQSSVVTMCTAMLNTQNLYVLPTQCVAYGSQTKQRLFPVTALTDWFFITETESVYCAVRTGYLNIN